VEVECEGSRSGRAPGGVGSVDSLGGGVGVGAPGPEAQLPIGIEAEGVHDAPCGRTTQLWRTYL